MTEAELSKWCRDNWNKIPEEIRKKCINHLIESIPYDVIQLWKVSGFGEAFHFYGGMAVRNLLRDVMVDGELPIIQTVEGFVLQNWDDFYTGALEELLETVI